MNMNNVMFNDQVKDSLIKGVNLIGDAVSTTFGPNARNVIIKHRGGLKITKDGATVATYVNDPDPFVQMGIDVVRDIAIKTAKDVGDGTSTSVILSQAIVKHMADSKLNPIEIQRKLKKDCDLIIEYLETKRRKISSYEDIKKVASLSANNDEKLGTLIADAFQQVGMYGVVNIEESESTQDSLKILNGMQIDSGLLSPFFINTDNNTCELENVQIAIFPEKLTEVKQIMPIADKANREGRALLIIAPKIDSAIQNMLIMNQHHGFKSCCIQSPGRGIYRDLILEDLKNIVGDDLICSKIIVDKETTTFINDKERREFPEIIASIKAKIENPDTAETDKIFYKKRLASYTGGVCTIKVGGFSKLEIQEKVDRIEDAVCATQAALEGGILPGGGTSLYLAYNDLYEKLHCLKQALIVPIKTLAVEELWDLVDTHVREFWKGINFKTGEVCDMYEEGIIDPFLVTKTSLENAVNSASLILTNGCSILKNE